MQNNNKIKYFLYARKSSESEDRQVASIQSQIDVLKDVAKRENLEIIDVLFESKSAKAPGRPVFNQMINRISNGEAEGIICWKLDRLARNPVDGGSISWMLQGASIKHIKVYDRSYYPTDNVLMMSVEFGMANQFIRDLSQNAKRGLRSKAEKGVYPGPAPLGYKNHTEKGIRDIIPDPERFDLVRKMFDLMLTGNYSPAKISKIVNEDWKLRMPSGKKIAISNFYKIFTRPFYCGVFEYPKRSGNWYKGIHKKLITEEEFDHIQGILGKKGKPSPKSHIFAFTGLMRCGECGALITAEEKIKRQKNGNIHKYIYYHCTKRKNPNCSQGCLEEKILEKQVLEALSCIEIPESFHNWALKYLKKDTAKEKDDIKKIAENRQKEYNNCLKKIDSLIEMRMNKELNEQEFLERKEILSKEKNRIQEILKDTDNRVDQLMEKVEAYFNFARDAKKTFENGTMEQKKDILSFLGSNLLISDKILSVIIQKPLVAMEKASKEVRVVQGRLEPLELLDNTTKIEALYSQNLLLQGRRDSNSQDLFWREAVYH